MARTLLSLFSQRVTPSLRSFSSPSTPLFHPIQKAATKTRFSARRTYATGESGPKPRHGQSTLKVWPFVAITLAGSATYIFMVRSRIATDMAPAIDAPKDSGRLAAPKKDTPTYSSDLVTVVFVLGGPGAGKGTQCANLVRDYGFTHLSAGDLLRAEQDRPGSEFGQLIKDCIKDGKIVPMEVTVQLLENAMTEDMNGGGGGDADKDSIKKKKQKGKFLIDGFPRKMDQALKFEETVCAAKFVLFFDVPEDVMEKRLLKRGETSGRTDDNKESIKKRFKTFVETSMPVVEYYQEQGRVVNVPAVKSPDEVYADTKAKVVERLGKSF